MQRRLEFSCEQQSVDRDTVDSVRNGEHMDSGFTSAVKNAMCTELSQDTA